MYLACRNYLINLLTESGVRKEPFTSLKKLTVNMSIHFGAVLFEGETFSRSTTKRRYVDEEGQHKRKKIFDRKMTFVVMIGDGSDEVCEEIFETFLQKIDRGINIDGNFTGIELENADWMEEGDNILKAKLAVQVKVIFEGGVYKDVDLLDASKLELGIRVEKVPSLRKEN